MNQVLRKNGMPHLPGRLLKRTAKALIASVEVPLAGDEFCDAKDRKSCKAGLGSAS